MAEKSGKTSSRPAVVRGSQPHTRRPLTPTRRAKVSNEGKGEPSIAGGGAGGGGR